MKVELQKKKIRSPPLPDRVSERQQLLLCTLCNLLFVDHASWGQLVSNVHLKRINITNN